MDDTCRAHQARDRHRGLDGLGHRPGARRPHLSVRRQRVMSPSRRALCEARNLCRLLGPAPSRGGTLPPGRRGCVHGRRRGFEHRRALPGAPLCAGGLSAKLAAFPRRHAWAGAGLQGREVEGARSAPRRRRANPFGHDDRPNGRSPYVRRSVCRPWFPGEYTASSRLTRSHVTRSQAAEPQAGTDRITGMRIGSRLDVCFRADYVRLTPRSRHPVT